MDAPKTYDVGFRLPCPSNPAASAGSSKLSFGAIARPIAWLRSGARIAALLMLAQAVCVHASFTLQWVNNDATSNETGFAIERSDAGAGFVQIATVAPTATSYQDTNATSAITYAYRVCAYNASGCSGYTNTATNALAFTIQPLSRRRRRRAG